MPVYCLVHGAGFGAWCWARVAAELRARGRDVVAPELPADRQSARLADYADAVVRTLAGVEEDVVLVGHSLGGLTTPLVAAARPVRHLAFLCAFVPEPGRSLLDQLSAEPVQPPGAAAMFASDAEGRRVFAPRDAVAAAFFHDCAEADEQAAWPRLRPQGTRVFAEPCPLDALPDVPRSSIVCGGDRVIAPAWSRRVARELLGVEPRELPGGHCPQLARPARLTEALLAACEA